MLLWESYINLLHIQLDKWGSCTVYSFYFWLALGFVDETVPLGYSGKFLFFVALSKILWFRALCKLIILSTGYVFKLLAVKTRVTTVYDSCTYESERENILKNFKLLWILWSWLDFALISAKKWNPEMTFILLSIFEIRYNAMSHMLSYVLSNCWKSGSSLGVFLDQTRIICLYSQSITRCHHSQILCVFCLCPFFSVLRFMNPIGMLTGASVVVAVFLGAVWAGENKAVIKNFKKDNPTLFVFLVMVASYLLMSLFGGVMVLLLGIKLPLMCESKFVHIFWSMIQRWNQDAKIWENLIIQTTYWFS